MRETTMTDRTTTDSTLNDLDSLIRTRRHFIAQLASGDVQPLARTLLMSTLVCSAVFGACLGSYRGGLQTLFAMVKFPVVILLTAAFTVPALSAMKSALGVRTSLVRDAALVLAALALATLVMAAAAPLLLLAITHGIPYHMTILMVVGAGGFGGLAGLSVLAMGLNDVGFKGRLTLLATTLAVFSLVGGELAWMLRPYLLRPSATSTTFLRAAEGTFFDAVSQSYDSARGIYREKE